MRYRGRRYGGVAVCWNGAELCKWGLFSGRQASVETLTQLSRWHSPEYREAGCRAPCIRSNAAEARANLIGQPPWKRPSLILWLHLIN